MLNRREAILAGAALTGGAALLRSGEAFAGTADGGGEFPREPEARQAFVAARKFPPGEPDKDYRPVITPNGGSLPFSIVAGVKVFHLVAEEVEHAFAPGLTARCWSFNGNVHGPTIEAVEGDRIRIYVTNRLPAPTSIHWHGLILPHGMDGVSGISQPPIPPGETWRYEFQLRQFGTFMYHSHHDSMTQDGLGMTGMLVIHPREPVGPAVDRDFAIMLHEWAIEAGASRPNPNVMSDFNVLTMNARIFPFTEPLVAATGDRVRIRFGNLSAMDHHPIHLHGYEFEEVAADGCEIPPDRRVRRVTVLVGVGQTRDIEFTAHYPGDWIFHCHMTHHMMNQMGHDFPNMIGAEMKDLDRRMRSLLPGYMTMGTKGMGDMTDMGMPIPDNSVPMIKAEGQFGTEISLGGMANVLKVRDGLTSYDDPGWYEPSQTSRARKATAEELAKDGIR